MPNRVRRKTSRGSRPSRPRRGARVAIIAGVAVLTLAIAGGAVMGIVLHRVLTGEKLRAWINTNPDKLRIDYASAEGWVPWNVRVHGLEMRSRDPNVEWWFRIDDVRLGFDPLALLAHRVHITRVRATGLAFRLRVRVPAGSKDTSSAHLEALPPIPGFASEPLRGDSPETPGTSRPFRIRVDDLRIAGVRELWIDIWHFGGEHADGTLAGSFDLLPRRSAQVGPARVELTGADLRLGPHLIASPVSFSTDAVIRRFDTRVVRGNAVWPFISGRASVAGPVAGLDFLNHFLRDDPEPRISGGAGSVRLSVDIDAGRGKGRLTAENRRVRARYRNADIVSDTKSRLEIRNWDFLHDRIDIGGSEVDLTHAAAAGPGPDSREWWGRFAFPGAHVEGGTAGAFVARVALHCRDARPLFTLFQIGLPGWARGVLKLEGLDGGAAVRLGSRHTDVTDLDVQGGAFRIRGRYRERETTKSGAFLLESRLFALGLDIDTSGSRLKLVGAREWFEHAVPKDEAR
jgi:hypothetical protein